MPAEQKFAVELNEKRPDLRLQVLLSEAGAANVAVLVAGEQKPLMWSGRVDPDAEAKVRAALSSELPPAPAGSDFQIKLTAGGQPLAARTWGIQSEPEQLRGLRRQLELLAHAPYVAGRAYLERGRAQESAQDYKGAAASYHRGIDEVGNTYSSAALEDDTGMKLVLAESMESNGDTQRAATLYGRVLESRVHAYAAKYQIK